MDHFTKFAVTYPHGYVCMQFRPLPMENDI